MTIGPALTDRAALVHQRARAAASGDRAMFLHDEAIADVQERLLVINKSFTSKAIVAAFPKKWAAAFPDARIVDDADLLDLKEGDHDLVIHAMALHWANDPVGQLVQARLALRPGGLFLGVLPGGETLHELRASLAEAEVALTGGLSPRILPMGEIRDLGALLQRAGFALPVADSHRVSATYPSVRHLMNDLRNMGEGNALATRERKPLSRALLEKTERIYRAEFSQGDRITATFELIVLTGWAPSAEQPRPLRPGSAAARLADALNTEEHSLPDPAKPGRI